MLDSLPRIPLFEDLTTEQRTKMLVAFEAFNCTPGTVIFEQGEPAHFLYLILKGKAVISYKPYDGPRIVLTRLKDGDVFGWSAVVGNHKYSSSVVSESTLESIRIDRDHLQTLVTKFPDVGKMIVDRLALNVSPRWQNAHIQIQPYLEEKRKSL